MSDRCANAHLSQKNRKKTAKRRLLFLLIPVCLAFAGTCLLDHAANDYYASRCLAFDFSSEGCDYTESTAALNNPGGGYYYIRGYLLSDDTSTDALDELLARDTRLCGDLNLILLEINLLRYKDRALSDSALGQIERILATWSDADHQIILRFLYDWDGNATATEPSSINLIRTHMTQTAPIVNAHAASIYTMQGIFVGNVAEMHGSNHMDTDSMCALMEHLASVTDPAVFLSVRTPAQRRTILSSAEPFPAGNALAARLGLFNDGMLGSESDLGTYGEVDRDSVDTDSPEALTGRWLRAQELAYQDGLCRLVPNGGEVTIDNSYNDLEHAVSDLSTMHVSYLNCMYHPDVLEKWRADTVHTDDAWDGTDGYTYVGAHLGYRYRCSGISADSFDFWTDDEADITLSLSNTGFSCSYEPLTMHVCVVNDADSTVVLQKDLENTDFLTLSGGECTDASLSLPLREYPDGSYHIYLSCTRDRDGREIALANSLPLTGYGYETASFSIDKTPTGTPSRRELLRQYLSHLSQSAEAKKSLAK